MHVVLKKQIWYGPKLSLKMFKFQVNYQRYDFFFLKIFPWYKDMLFCGFFFFFKAVWQRNEAFYQLPQFLKIAYMYLSKNTNEVIISYLFPSCNVFGKENYMNVPFLIKSSKFHKKLNIYIIFYISHLLNIYIRKLYIHHHQLSVNFSFKIIESHLIDIVFLQRFQWIAFTIENNMISRQHTVHKKWVRWKGVNDIPFPLINFTIRRPKNGQ